MPDPAAPAPLATSEPTVTAIYTRLLACLAALDQARVEPKETSVHFVRTIGFAGVIPRKSALILNVRLDHALESERPWRSEEVSKHRWQHEFRLEQPDDVDEEIVELLREAYALAG